jgi:hypothetical protein
MSDGRFAGVDWASEEHAVCVVDERGRILEGRRYRHNEPGIRALCSRLVRLQVALVALVALRAGTLTGRSLTKRRSARGSRVTDPALAMFVLPVALLRSLIRLVLLAPLAIVAGALAAAVTVLVSPAHSLPQAGAYAAGAIVAFYGLGPGSSSSRKPLARFFNALGRNPASATVVFIGMAAVAIGAIAAAATHPPFYWPFSNLNLRLQQLPGSHSLLHDVWAGVLRLIGRQP